MKSLVNFYLIAYVLLCTLSYYCVSPQTACQTTAGKPGVCAKTVNCQSAKDDYTIYGIRPTRCKNTGKSVLICCTGPIDDPTSSTNFQSQYGNKKSISEAKCDEYSSHVTKTVESLLLSSGSDTVTTKIQNCEYSNTELIVGGTEAIVGEFPHIVNIGWDTNKGKKWMCGGSLISDEYVLTAAHCTYLNDQNTVIDPQPKTVRLGEHDLKSTDDGANPIDVNIKTLMNHPAYRPPRKYNDIALIQLETKINFNKFIRPACLWTKPDIQKNTAIAVGWGVTEFQGNPSDVLKKVTLDIIKSDVCSTKYKDRKRLPQSIIDQQMCAGNLTGGSDTCQGDSGGPLEIYSTSNQCIHYIIGITSFGNGCGFADTAGVYTKVSSYISWIESIVWPNQ